MTASALALLGYITWTLILIVINEILRTVVVMRGRNPGSGFRPDGSDVSPFAHRLARAHANCYESFPLVGGVLLLAMATGNTAVTDPLAMWLLGARVLQSGAHLYSTGAVAATVRFAFFAIQLGIIVWWVAQFWLQGVS